MFFIVNKAGLPPEASAQGGQSLVEVLIALALTALVLPALLTGLVASRQGKPQQMQRQQAAVLMQEAMEAVRGVREDGWTNFAIDGTFHVATSSGKWVLASGVATPSAGFTSSVVISDVCRNSTNTIASCATNSVDPSTKQVVITVTWQTPTVSSVSSTAYVTRYLDNLSFTQTTQADFNAGTLTNTATTNTSGGEVTLGAGGFGDWCNPSQSIVKTFDMPGNGVTVAISAASTASLDYAYSTTGGNASGDSVDALNISHPVPTATPIVTNPASNNEAKAYGIFVDSSANYVYFNEANPPKHTVRIANGTTLANAGYYDASGNGTGTSVFVSGSTGYTTVGNKLYAFTASPINNNGASSQGELWSTTLAGNGKRVVVVGSKAYVATDSTTNQLQIIDTGTHAVTTSVNVGNGLAGVDLYVYTASSPTQIYLVTSWASGKNDVFAILDSDTTKIYGASTSGMTPKGVIGVFPRRIIVVGSGGTQTYQVFNANPTIASTPSSPVQCGGVNPTGVTSINAVAPVVEPDNSAYSYIITDNSTQEFQIIRGGPGGGGIANNGNFISSAFDAGHSTAFNRFTLSQTVPSNTGLTYQVAVANPQGAQTCATAAYTFVGPDHTTSSVYTTATGTVNAIPFYSDPVATGYQNPGRCFRYKAIFTSDFSDTPIFSDITVNYSP
ncbi:MAG TPA: hypothetical protein VLH19_00760 [Patescibacteria group bacterium]|nr:hypothetical protein [Patescibacteria group bacterium]